MNFYIFPSSFWSNISPKQFIKSICSSMSVFLGSKDSIFHDCNCSLLVFPQGCKVLLLNQLMEIFLVLCLYSGCCVFCINMIRDCFWGNVVRVYPWIVQGLTFLSAWKTQCINNYNTCCVLYKLMPLFLLSISELVTSVAFIWFCVLLLV